MPNIACEREGKQKARERESITKFDLNLLLIGRL
jgi:hypothetical protein